MSLNIAEPSIKKKKVQHLITTPSREKTVELVLENKQKETFILLHQKIIHLLLEKNYQNIESVLAEHYQFWVEV